MGAWEVLTFTLLLDVWSNSHVLSRGRRIWIGCEDHHGEVLKRRDNPPYGW